MWLSKPFVLLFATVAVVALLSPIIVVAPFAPLHPTTGAAAFLFFTIARARSFSWVRW